MIPGELGEEFARASRTYVGVVFDQALRTDMGLMDLALGFILSLSCRHPIPAPGQAAATTP